MVTDINVQTLGGFNGTGLPPFKLLDAAAAAGAGHAVDLGSAVGSFTAQISATGTPTTFSVQLEGSLDKVTWTRIGAPMTSAGLYAISGVAVPFVRFNLTALTGGTAPTVTGLLAGSGSGTPDTATDSPPNGAVITKSDSTVYSPPLKALSLGVGGDVQVTFVGGQTVLIPALLGGVQHSFAITKVWSTNTTATGIVGYW